MMRERGTIKGKKFIGHIDKKFRLKPIREKGGSIVHIQLDPSAENSRGKIVEHPRPRESPIATYHQ